MRFIFISLAIAALAMMSGCGPSPSAPGSNRVDSPTLQATGDADLSIPVLPARKVVFLTDWQPDHTDDPPTRSQAQEILRRADYLKAFGEYAKAEQAYQQAMGVDPTWSYPPYQLACNYELSGQHQQAVASFQKAIELGFDDFPTALRDDELGAIRRHDSFAQHLSEIRARYIQAGESRVGVPIAVRPEGTPPAEGWPLIFLLHGYGDTNISYLDNAKRWAKLGFLAIAVPGTVPTRPGHYIWSTGSLEPTHENLQAIVQADQIRDVIDSQRVYLLGFSQGALHALLLTADYRSSYAGVIALSPGGPLAERLASPAIQDGRPAQCLFVHGTKEPHAEIASRWRDACAARGWQFELRTHNGGHHFPVDWEAYRPQAAKLFER